MVCADWGAPGINDRTSMMDKSYQPPFATLVVSLECPFTQVKQQKLVAAIPNSFAHLFRSIPLCKMLYDGIAFSLPAGRNTQTMLLL